MKNQRGVARIVSMILVVIFILLILATCYFAYKYYSLAIQNQHQDQEQNQQQGETGGVSQNTSVEDVYSFKSSAEEIPDQQYPNYYVEIYKNQQMVAKIFIEDTNTEPIDFVLSPDKKYVAFKTAIGGGTCVAIASPKMVDLNDFSVVALDDSDINKKLGSALGIDVSKVIKFSAFWQEIKDINWLSNDKIEVSMKFGDKTLGGCPIAWANKPASSPKEVEVDVEFTIVAK